MKLNLQNNILLKDKKTKKKKKQKIELLGGKIKNK